MKQISTLRKNRRYKKSREATDTDGVQEDVMMDDQSALNEIDVSIDSIRLARYAPFQWSKFEPFKWSKFRPFDSVWLLDCCVRVVLVYVH